jgi:hypothetical protein
MPAPVASPLGPETVAFYQDAMRVLREAGQRFLMGGAYAFGPYTGSSAIPRTSTCSSIRWSAAARSTRSRPRATGAS